LPRTYSPPDGQIIQAFTFALDLTPEQAAQIARFFGARRLAFNWTLNQMKADLERYRETGESEAPPTFFLCVSVGTRKRTTPRWSVEPTVRLSLTQRVAMTREREVRHPPGRTTP
jgi:hypothetical protein